MPKKKPRRGQAAGRRSSDAVTGRTDSTRACARNQHRSAPASTLPVDLVGLRERLVGARRRLVERIADDFPPDRRFPDTGWSRLLADVHLCIAAVDAVMDEGGP